MMRYIYTCDAILYWFSTFSFESLIGQLSGYRIQYRLWCIIFHLASTTLYIWVFSPYLRANVFIWCCSCFICLKFWKKMNKFVFFNVCRGFPIFPFFCRCFPKRCFPETDVFHTGSMCHPELHRHHNKGRSSCLWCGHLAPLKSRCLCLPSKGWPGPWGETIVYPSRRQWEGEGHIIYLVLMI